MFVESGIGYVFLFSSIASAPNTWIKGIVTSLEPNKTATLRISQVRTKGISLVRLLMTHEAVSTESRSSSEWDAIHAIACLFPTNSEHKYQLSGTVTVSVIVILEEQEIHEEHGAQKKNLLINRGVRREGQAERISVGELRETTPSLLTSSFTAPDHTFLM